MKPRRRAEGDQFSHMAGDTFHVRLNYGFGLAGRTAAQARRRYSSNCHSPLPPVLSRDHQVGGSGTKPMTLAARAGLAAGVGRNAFARCRRLALWPCRAVPNPCEKTCGLSFHRIPASSRHAWARRVSSTNHCGINLPFSPRRPWCQHGQ